METKTLVMLLFVCNGTETESIISDTRQMLDSAYNDIDKNEMMPEEFENKNIPYFTLHVDVPRLPAETKSNSDKGCNHYKEHGKKAFHFKVTKDDEPLAPYGSYVRFSPHHGGRNDKLKIIITVIPSGNTLPPALMRTWGIVMIRSCA